ncbi:putative ankyrin repeat-containing protein [Daldinia vernicosa]|uniref:putative ankyrin repeat-containing protein n=1 Tax=Daldinia vernicosa TaxID=114800 RepID=UPI002007FF93|nr:putative ankyrin repeat-containing protein [Daldinia vernicosa]KAI0852291.1 putative ankyrin repeat-containing protein [Daldinia vernicosa]
MTDASKTIETLAEKDSKPKLHHHTWTLAIEQLRKQEDYLELYDLSKQDPLTTLTDVLKATNEKKDECIKKRWKVTLKGRTIILRDVLEKIAVWVDKFLMFGDIAIQYDPVSAALPWAAVRLIMKATVNDVEAFGYVLQSIESVTNVIASCSIIERHFLQPEHSRMNVFEQLSKSVVSLYISILKYLSSIIHYYGKNWVIRFVKSVVVSKADLEAKHSTITAAKRELWDLLELAESEKSQAILEGLKDVTAAQIAQNSDFRSFSTELRKLEEPVKRIDYHVQIINDNLERDTRARVLKAISTIPYGAHHKTVRRGRLKDSGQWLFKKKEYKIWREESASSVLWLHGIPGCGKTKLASIVIDELATCDNLAYFYCMRNPAEPFRAQCSKILASLVRQLACQGTDKPILPPVVEHYEDAIAGFEGFEDQHWDAEESTRMLLALMEHYPTATIVIDALDEVELQDRQELMDVLGQLLQESPNLLKIFVSSRDNYDIALHLEGSPNVYIDADDNAGDISAFIKDQLASARLLRNNLPDSLRDEIIETLIRGARGMFRWVDLQIQSLRPLKVAADIKARLGVLPSTLEGSYWEIYQSILESGDHAAALANFTFQWLMYAKDSLSIEAFASIASSALSSEMSSTFSGAEVTDVCSNLIVIRGKDFEFAHLSVREFFEGISKPGIETFLSAQSNGFISVACLRYLTKQLLQAPGIITETINNEVKRSSPGYLGVRNTQGTRAEYESRKRSMSQFVDDLTSGLQSEPIIYTTHFWVFHARHSSNFRESEPLSRLIKEFLIDPHFLLITPTFVLWCEIMQSKGPDSGLLSDDKLSWENLKIISRPFHPIWLACANGWFDVIQYLYDVHRLDIERLIYSNYGDLVDNAKAWSNALGYAIINGNVAIVEFILSCTINPMKQLLSRKKIEPLVLAAKADDTSMLSILLEKEHGGSEIEGRAAIMAVSNGHKSSLELLVHHNPQLIRELGVGRPALLEACKLDHIDIATFLIENGAPTEQGEKFLFHAVVRSRTNIIKLLLDKGIGLGGLDKALITAISQADKENAQLLLRHGAQMEKGAVIRSIRAGLVDSTVQLIKAGFDVQGNYLEKRRTALHYAAEEGSFRVIQALLEARVPMNSCDRDGQTPLHLAAQRGHFACVRLLLSNGVDALVKNNDGKLPLDLAEIKHHTSTAELIRKRMAMLKDEPFHLRSHESAA